jgi:hypothetical protein
MLGLGMWWTDLADDRRDSLTLAQKYQFAAIYRVFLIYASIGHRMTGLRRVDSEQSSPNGMVFAVWHRI